MATLTSRKSMICGRADRLLGATAAAVAAATGAGLVGTESQADADVTYRIGVNINVPSNIDGVYLNVTSGATGTLGGSVPGWDVNPYGAAANQFFSAFAGGNFVSAVGGGNPMSLAYGTNVDGTNLFGGSTAAVAQGVNGWVVGDNILGFRFTHDGTNQTHYGWMLLNVTNFTGGQPRTIVSYAFENTPGAAITAVPEPSTFGFLAAGAVGLLAARRRRVA